MSRRPEVMSSRFEEIRGDIETAIDAIEAVSEFPEGHSPRQVRYEIRNQVSKLRLFNNEVYF